MASITPTGREVGFPEDDIIVTKTDLKGHITYANQVFVRVSGYTEAEVLGKPHNLIRHPDMPGCVFGLLWDTLQQRREVFAYVLNLAKSGSHYWVLAHVTPSYDLSGNHIGYHSSRRAAYVDALPAVKTLYARLLGEEQQHALKKEGLVASSKLLADLLRQQGKSYGEFVFGLSKFTAVGAGTS